jgi:hypothetical protein
MPETTAHLQCVSVRRPALAIRFEDEDEANQWRAFGAERVKTAVAVKWPVALA